MQRFRTFVAISLLLVFAWSRAAEALPLVWCLGSDGHSVIELASSGGCHGSSTTDVYVDSGYATSLIGSPVGDHSDGDCNDYSIADELRSPIKVSKTLAPPVPVTAVVASFRVHYTVEPTRFAVLADPVPHQLAQLRTVVLRL